MRPWTLGPIILLLLSIGPLHSPLTAQGATLRVHVPIFIDGDLGWTDSNGVLLGGNGSSSNPYIIESWDISAPTTPGIHIRNTRSYFIIRNVFIHDANSTGILFENVANGMIQASTITGDSDGIILAGCTRNIVQSNSLLHNTYGIEVEGGANNTLSGNRALYSSQYGFWITGGSTLNRVINNNSSNNTYAGFLVGGNTNNFFEGNTAANNTWYGFRISVSSANTLRNNTISENQFGMIFEHSSNNTAIDNQAIGNGYGMGLEFGNSNNTFTGNTLVNNQFGIYVTNSSRNRIYNNYLQNTVNTSTNNPNNAWNITKTTGRNVLGGPFLGGNFYSDYAGQDPNLDGIGDSPYNMTGSGGALDYLPLVKFHDVSVDKLTAQPTSVIAGQTVKLIVSASNQGNYLESFKVNVYYNQTLLQTENITSLAPSSQRDTSFYWNTNTSLSGGSYELTAVAANIPGDINATDNISPPAFVEITRYQSPIVSINIGPSSPLVGETINFTITSVHGGTPPFAFSWNLGEGSNISATTALHVYLTAGNYAVTLKVKDGLGQTTTVSQILTVTATVPSSPINLHATAVSGLRAIILEWEPPATNGGFPIKGYRIYRGSSPSSSTFLKVSANYTAYEDTGILLGQTYYYRISAFSDLGEGISSYDVSAGLASPMPPEAPGQPSNPSILNILLPILIAVIAGLILLGWMRRTRQSSPEQPPPSQTKQDKTLTETTPQRKRTL